mgnify:CR=1 FL=1
MALWLLWLFIGVFEGWVSGAFDFFRQGEGGVQKVSKPMALWLFIGVFEDGLLFPIFARPNPLLITLLGPAAVARWMALGLGQAEQAAFEGWRFQPG